MINFGSIGKSLKWTISNPLVIGSAVPVITVTKSFYSVQYMTPNLQVKTGTINKPPLLLTSISKDSSPFKIMEVTALHDVPQALMVRLTDRDTGQVIDEKESNANGVITFTRLEQGKPYTLIALDPENTYNADIVDLRYPD